MLSIYVRKTLLQILIQLKYDINIDFSQTQSWLKRIYKWKKTYPLIASNYASNILSPQEAIRDLANKNPSEIQNDGAINKRRKKTDKKFQNEEESLKDIKEIIYDLSISFDGKTNDEILDIFKNTSFNVQNAYLYLTDPEYFRGISLFNYLELGYSEPDDKIIKTFEKSSVYAKLLELKGKESMFERKGFSKIK